MCKLSACCSAKCGSIQPRKPARDARPRVRTETSRWLSEPALRATAQKGQCGSSSRGRGGPAGCSTRARPRSWRRDSGKGGPACEGPQGQSEPGEDPRPGSPRPAHGSRGSRPGAPRATAGRGSPAGPPSSAAAGGWEGLRRLGGGAARAKVCALQRPLPAGGCPADTGRPGIPSLCPAPVPGAASTAQGHPRPAHGRRRAVSSVTRSLWRRRWVARHPQKGLPKHTRPWRRGKLWPKLWVVPE